MLKFIILGVCLHTVMCVDPEVIITDTYPETRHVKGNIQQMTIEKNKDAYMTCVVHDKPENRKVEWLGVTDTGFSFPISMDLASEDPFKWQLDSPSFRAWRLKVQNCQMNSSDILYICQVLIGDKKYARDERKLRVVESPKIRDLVSASDRTVEEVVDKLVLECNAVGFPTPKITWQRLAGGLLPTGGLEVKNPTLNLGPAAPEHRGYYKCTAENDAGSDSRIVKIQVKFKPRVTAAFPRITQALGYRQDLICTAEAFPVPLENEFAWSKNGRMISSDRTVVKFIEGASDRVTSKLIINNVQNEDLGEYTCSAKNNFGEHSQTIVLALSDSPMPDSRGKITSGAALLSISFTTILMLLIACLLH